MVSCLVQNFTLSSFVINLVSIVKFSCTVGLMVAVCVGFDGGGGIVHIFYFKALENVENAVGRMEVVVHYNCASAACSRGNNSMAISIPILTKYQ